MGYDHAQRGNATFLAFSSPGSAPDHAPAPVAPGLGYLWHDGQAAAFRTGTPDRRRRRCVAAAPSSFAASDALDRKLEAVGDCVNRISFTNTQMDVRLIL